ncbi:hypothetical protein MASR2M79_20080 [Aminivibrio sp.]
MKKTLFIAAAIIIGGLLIGALDMVHPFGNPGAAPMDNYYLENSLKELSTENIVTSIVFDYRGFDTLGEAAVLFTALCSITVLFREGRKK